MRKNLYCLLPQLWSAYQPFAILASAHITLLMFSWRSQVNSRLPNPMLWFQPPPYLISAWRVALWGHSSFPQWPSLFGFEVTLSLLSFQSILLLFLCILFWLSHKYWEAPRLHLGHLSTLPLPPSPPLIPRISNRPVNSASLSMFKQPSCLSQASDLYFQLDILYPTWRTYQSVQKAS